MDTDVTGQVGGAAGQVQELALDTSLLLPQNTKHKTKNKQKNMTHDMAPLGAIGTKRQTADLCNFGLHGVTV